MAQPEFTPYERYLISMYKAGAGSSQYFTWLLIGGAALLFLIGLSQDDNALLFTGFGLLVFWSRWRLRQRAAARPAPHAPAR